MKNVCHVSRMGRKWKGRKILVGKFEGKRPRGRPGSRREDSTNVDLNLLNPTGHVMHQQFNIQQLYVLPTLYLCVLYLSENEQRLVPLIA